MGKGIPPAVHKEREAMMKHLLLVLSAISALIFGTVAASAAATVTISPWAYSCGHTEFGNPVHRDDTPGSNGCSGDDVQGTAAAALVSGTLTLSKECGEAEAAKCTADDLASGATVGGLKTLTAASVDLVEGSYCGAGAPRLNVVTTDGDLHFFGCSANRSGNHVSFNLTAAGDGNGKGGIVGKQVKSIDFVQDETGTAIMTNLTFEGQAAVTATPTPAATSAPPQLATTGRPAGIPPLALVGLGLLGLGISGLAIRRRAG
jgi:hypothetical protein